jgi:hypothetical protein
MGIIYPCCVWIMPSEYAEIKLELNLVHKGYEYINEFSLWEHKDHRLKVSKLVVLKKNIKSWIYEYRDRNTNRNLGC